jgi:hypothetical protein
MQQEMNGHADGAPATVDAAVAFLDDQAAEDETGVTPVEEATEAESEHEPEHEVTLTSGERIKLPLSELAGGYLRAQDYAAQTAELTEQRRALAEMHRRLEAAASHAGALRPEHLAQLLPPLQLPDPALAQVDPAAYGRQRAAVDAELMRRQQLAQALQQETGRRAAALAAERQAALAEQKQRLVAAWPELAGAGAAEQIGRLRNGLAERYGFSAEEIESIGDHRLMLLARDALRWRQAEAQAHSAQPVRRPPPRTAAPAARAPAGERGDGTQGLLARIGRTGSRERDIRLAAQYLLS